MVRKVVGPRLNEARRIGPTGRDCLPQIREQMERPPRAGSLLL
jgi:hypothetical protein